MNLSLSLQLCILLSAVLPMACAHRYRIESEPSGAQVYVIDERGQDGELLGETPLELTAAQLESRGVLGLSKQGFVSQHVAVPVAAGFSVELFVPLERLSDQWVKGLLQGPVHAGVLNESLREIFILQGHVLRKRLPEAETLIEQMRGRYDHVSLFHSLIGNFNYIRENFSEAELSYTKALELDPKNDEARKMLSLLKDRLKP